MNGPRSSLTAWLIGLLCALQAHAEVRILATLPTLHAWAANVAGDAATVESLLPPNVGPHDFQFRPSDLRKLAAADVVLMNGLGVDTWLTRAVGQGASKPSRQVVTVTRGLEDRLIHHLTPLAMDDSKGSRKAPAKEDHDHDHGHDHAGEDGNPHVWLDPVFAQHCVSNIITALCQADPAHADGYTRRGEAYLRELDQLDGEIRSSLKALTQRKVVTFHDAFPYFCQRYDLKLVGVVQEVPSVDPSPKYLARLSRAIRAQGVRVIFSEPQFHPRLLKRLADDLQVGVAELDVLETGTASKTFYVEGMRKNLRTLEAALR